MRFYDLDVHVKHKPPLAPEFLPYYAFMTAYERSVEQHGGKKLAIVLRDGLRTHICETEIHGKKDWMRTDRLYVERLVKTLLWMKGGCSIAICGDHQTGEYIASVYAKDGKRAFDADFMSNVYNRPFTVQSVSYGEKPRESERPALVGGNLKGCRIGFDAGGSDRKVSAVVDGETIFSEEVVWHPKLHDDPDYHYREIVGALKKAASMMPRVDAVGISSAGIFADNLCKAASLFIKVPRELFVEKVQDIYLRACKEIGSMPVMVCNDGDVAALAGALDLGVKNILGIAMGTSEAGGYLDNRGCIMGWLNELAFMPVDLSENGTLDEWSGDRGCGVKYFSQDAAIKLAGRAGIAFQSGMSPAEKLSAIQKLSEADDPRACEIFESIGVYLGYGIALYHRLYGMEHLLLLGRVMSGKGGNQIVKTAKKILGDEYPLIAEQVQIHLPEENSRRLGQSVAAASLPVI